MTNTPDLAGNIRRDLYAIADHYDATLEPARHGAGAHVSASKEPPLPISAHILDVRAEAHRDLAYWARFLLDEVRDVNGNPLQHGPTSLAVDVLVPFVATWADWLVQNMPDDADNLASDAHDHAAALLGIVAPRKREWVNIGKCPRTVAADGESVTCGTSLRAYPGRETIQCDGCLHDDTLDWWRQQVLGHRPRLVTPTELVDVLLVDLRIVIDPETVRQWFKRGKVKRHGRDDRGRWLYDWQEVMAALVDRRAA